jgi:hypothetical protein
MYGYNVFAVLTAVDTRNMASSAFKLSHNSQWFRKAEGGVAEEPTIGSRETTPAALEEGQSETVNENSNHNSTSGAIDRLIVTFDGQWNNLDNGIQLGSNKNLSHILLGHRGTKGISDRQCNITIDDNLWIWLHDYYSTHGTAVSHNGQNEREARRKETWILAYEPGAMYQFRDTRIHCGNLAFEIEFPNHNAKNTKYVKNLRAFVDSCGTARTGAKVPAIERLGLESNQTTQAATDAPTPGERLIYYDLKCIGKGQFGEVSISIRGRDGLLCAAKTFKPQPNKRKLEEEDPTWLTQIRKEFTLMRDNPHVSCAVTLGTIDAD